MNAAPGVSTADPWEKDYAWGDLDKDGDIDLVCVRKFPVSCPGGKTRVLFMNENGVLTDRTSTYAQQSDTPGDLGFNTEVNDRDVVIVDIDNDGWLDVVTCNTISDGLPKVVGHPRVYHNRGESGGVWLGLRHEDFRIPQLLTTAGNPANPRFCEMAAGDVNGDGYVDLYFADYDTGEVGPSENAANDIDNRLLINLGAANPGVFVDQSTLRMGSNATYPGGAGTHNYLWSKFGAGAVIVDLNMDGNPEVVKCSTLNNPADHVAVMRNNPSNVGFFDTYTVIDNLSPYHVQAGDLNNDGKPDLVVSEDATDRYYINTTTTVGGVPTFNSVTFPSDLGTEGGFSGASRIADLDNDGYKDVIIADVDIDTDGCSRQTHIYKNRFNTPSQEMRELSPSILPAATLHGIYDAAVFDINGDGWNDIVLGKCTSTGSNGVGFCGGTPAGSMEVWINIPLVNYDLPAGAPSFVAPNTITNVQANVVATGGSVNASDRLLIYKINNGSWTSTPLTPVSGNLFEAQLPAINCNDDVSYYFKTTFTTGEIFVFPQGAPGITYHLKAFTGQEVTLQSFEGATDEGWTVSNDASLTGGAWVRVDPNGTISSGNQAQPEDDYEPAPNVMCWVTGQGAVGGTAGAADVDGGATRLTSPPIDLTGTDAQISYARWFFGGAGDSFTVEVSNNNGANWTTVETVTTSGSTWQPASFGVGQFFPGQALSANVRVRFTTADTGTATTCEGGLDAFQVNKLVCVAVPQCACSSDLNNDHIRDANDIQGFVNCFMGGGTNCICGDLDLHGTVDDVDIPMFVDEIITGNSCP